jgi:hypothetical protein
MSDAVANYYSGPTGVQIGRGSRQLGRNELTRVAMPIWRDVKKKLLDLAPKEEPVKSAMKKSEPKKTEPKRKHKRSRISEALGDDTY